MKLQTITKKEEETIEFAEGFLKEALEKMEGNGNRPLVFWLEGELGAGKTQFVKGLAATLGIKEKITSPTFVLMKKFEISVRGGLTPFGGSDPPLPRSKKYFYHIDCYRIYDTEDARRLGIDKIIKNPRAIVAVEWAERIADIIPKPYWKIKFEHAGENKRKVNIKYVKK